MPNNKQQNWKEEFDKKFSMHQGEMENDYLDCISSTEIKAFIQSLLNKALTEAEGEEKLFKSQLPNYDGLGKALKNKDIPLIVEMWRHSLTDFYNAHRSHVSEIKKKFNL